MAEKDTDMPVAAPTWKFEWNPNTVINIVGFAIVVVGGLMAWGYVVAEFRGALATHTVDLDRLNTRIVALEKDSRRLDNHELRIGNVEKQATDAATAMRAVETTLNALTTDIRVVREILQRLEAGQNGRDPAR